MSVRKPKTVKKSVKKSTAKPPVTTKELAGWKETIADLDMEGRRLLWDIGQAMIEADARNAATAKAKAKIEKRGRVAFVDIAPGVPHTKALVAKVRTAQRKIDRIMGVRS